MRNKFISVRLVFVMSKKILVLVSHPQLQNSRINDALSKSASEHPAVTVRHVDDVLVKEGTHFDADTEHRILDAHDAIVLQFPWYWYAMPGTLKKYLDEVLTPGWAYRGGNALEKKPLLVAVSTGGPEQAYIEGGKNLFPMTTLLAPLIATANMVNMEWKEPFTVHGARTLSDGELALATSEYVNRLDELVRELVTV